MDVEDFQEDFLDEAKQIQIDVLAEFIFELETRLEKNSGKTLADYYITAKIYLEDCNYDGAKAIKRVDEDFRDEMGESVKVIIKKKKKKKC